MESWAWQVKLGLCLIFLCFGLFKGSIFAIFLAVGWYILALDKFNKDIKE